MEIKPEAQRRIHWTKVLIDTLVWIRALYLIRCFPAFPCARGGFTSARTAPDLLENIRIEAHLSDELGGNRSMIDARSVAGVFHL